MDDAYYNWRLNPNYGGLNAVRQHQEQIYPPFVHSVPPQQDPKNPYWVRTWPGAKDVQYNVIDNLPYGPGVHGWTACDKDTRACQVIIQRNSDQACVRAHENLHASGWDHPNHPRGYICPTNGMR